MVAGQVVVEKQLAKLLFESTEIAVPKAFHKEKLVRNSWRPHSLTDLTLSRAFGRSAKPLVEAKGNKAIVRSAVFSSSLKLTVLQSSTSLSLLFPLTQPSSV
jgi:hypothetical protein